MNWRKNMQPCSRMVSGWTVIWYSLKISRSRTSVWKNIQMNSVHVCKKHSAIRMNNIVHLSATWHWTELRVSVQWVWIHHLPYCLIRTARYLIISNSFLHRLQTRQSMRSVKKLLLLPVYMSVKTETFWYSNRRTVMYWRSFIRYWQIPICWKSRICIMRDSK